MGPQRWAAGIMVVLGAGHLGLSIVLKWSVVVGWVARGGWAAVPLIPADRSEAALVNGLTFWAGPGSFAVPLLLLGCLTWHLAGRGVTLPVGIGWGLAVWCLVGGVLLVPSPYFLGVVAGVLLVVARGRAVTGIASGRPGPVQDVGGVDGGDRRRR
ncbi:DUF6463 family protein [Saccharothrix violaceirubra]|uniref:Uncharacterized protein n=1 Tax=Saccharothrix violaceirubra TaxID=413306 RepID=A0A7W7WW92_9PSEU|nr:DUF6463 family protein [Saccharothrix violaceirubra]MBB4966125.1 hypothetical protein [Saccharothrix violaceirubra]